MKLKQLLQKAVIYPAIIGSLFLGAYRCGDGSEPDPTEDAQVEVDAGVKLDSGNLEDVLNTPDADKDVLDSDVPNGDNYQPDTDVKDGGLDASDVNITDVPHYDGGDLTDVLDGGYDANDTGGDTVTDVGDAGQNLPPAPKLKYSFTYPEVWTDAHDGEVIVKPLNEYEGFISIYPCDSYDLDGKIVEIWLDYVDDYPKDSGSIDILYGGGECHTGGVGCGNLTGDPPFYPCNNETTLRIKDDDGTESKLSITFKIVQ